MLPSDVSWPEAFMYVGCAFAGAFAFCGLMWSIAKTPYRNG